MGRRTDLYVIRPPNVNREPYVWFRTQDLNFRGTNPLSCVRAPGGWFMAPSRAAAYPHHAQQCLRLADLTTSPAHRGRFSSLGFPRSRPWFGFEAVARAATKQDLFRVSFPGGRCDTRSPPCLI